MPHRLSLGLLLLQVLPCEVCQLPQHGLVVFVELLLVLQQQFEDYKNKFSAMIAARSEACG